MKTLSWDTETKGFSWWTPREQAFLITWADESGEWWADVEDEAAVQRFIDDVRAADTLVGHNSKFDIHQVRATIGLDIAALGKELHCTDLMSRVLFPEGQNKGARGGHGLKNLASVHLRTDAKDPEEAIKEMAATLGLRTIKQTGAYYDVYRAFPAEMRNYALADARYTRDLFDVFRAKAAQEPAQARIYEMERRVLPVLINAERIGVKTDQDKVAEFKREFTQQRDEIHERLTTELGDTALGGEGSEAALIEGLQKHGVPLYQRTDEGKLSTSKFALQEFEADFPIVADLSEFRRVERFLNTYLGPMDGVEVIHPNFGQIGAWTGRMSCRTPNLQNWPKRAGKHVRSVLVPRPGHCFVVCDYEGIEARLLAYYLNDPWYRELVSERDPHAWMCTQIWGGEVEEYVKGSAKELTHRGPAKNILFAITYGAGAKRVMSMLRDAGFPSDEASARTFIRKIKNSLPNYWHLTKDRIEPKVRQHGFVTTIAGRKSPVKREKAYVGLSGLIQGSAADLFKLGVIATADAVRPLGAVPLMFVHDELVTEVRTEHAEECLALQIAAMCSAWDLDPLLAVEGSIAYNNYAEA